MGKISMLVVLSFAGVAACVDSGTDATNRVVDPDRATEMVVSSELAKAPASESVTCDDLWECDWICGTWVNGTLVRYPTNVLHQYCSDGSDTVLVTHRCGEECF